jgi:hypothetical protein
VSLSSYTGLTIKIENFGLMDSFACGSCGEALFGHQFGSPRKQSVVTFFGNRPCSLTHPRSRLNISANAVASSTRAGDHFPSPHPSQDRRRRHGCGLRGGRREARSSRRSHHDPRFDTKTFMELRNAQSVTIAYDGTNPMPPMFCYLKPYYNNVNKSYFRQLADGEL